ncbi:MAG: glutathione synthase [Rhodospirillaceae bacterium]|nr:glutathione synthase [Rhodospirillaceae bacterium]
MPIKVALQMDPIETINIDGDSSFVIGLEAIKRGHELYYYQPKDMALDGATVVANSYKLDLRREKGNHFSLSQQKIRNIGDMDVVFLRQDPPFDMSYITTTYLLDMVHPKTLVVNNPTEVRGNSEKLYVARFPELMAPTLVSRNVQQISEFRTQHKDIILKPLYGNGGAGVFHVSPDDENMSALLDMMFAQNNEPIMVQAYLPDVRGGDKRIILIDGEPLGAINRIPPPGDARANMHAGGKAFKSELDKRDKEICAAIGPDLKKRGLLFAGIDVIGGYLTEINVTSPTGLQEIAKFDGHQLETQLWDAIEKRLK